MLTAKRFEPSRVKSLSSKHHIGATLNKGNYHKIIMKSNSNNNDFFYANILEDQAQWRDKTRM